MKIGVVKMRNANLLVLASCFSDVVAKTLWATEPVDLNNIILEAYPVGNGKLGALPLGIVGQDIVVLNEHSLWSGGPFESPDYIGGNPPSPVFTALPGIRETIWQTQISNNISALYGPPDDYFYGNYETLANLTVTVAGITQASNYNRSLNLENGIHQTSFQVNETTFTTTIFCTYPDQVCVYNLQSTAALPNVTVGFQDSLRSGPSSNISCDANGMHIRGQTQEDIGMVFDARVQVISVGSGKDTLNSICVQSGDLLILSNGESNTITLVYAAGTDYNPKNGNAKSNYSFKGVDPEAKVLSTIRAVTHKNYQDLYNAHVLDFRNLFGQFSLNLLDPNNSTVIPTAEVLSRYTIEVGDPFLESLIFDYGRYLFISSSRPGSLPPNLQGLWTEQLAPPWSADYHVDINLEMNHWHTEQTGLGEISQPLWDYMTDTWVPRGTETAYLLYDAPGYVGFCNLNIFGFTGQENDAVWSDYPASAAWMVKHAWDRYDYSRDVSWYQSTGYPLIKGVAEYWISQMIPDQYFNDGTLVAVPCNSPEHGWTTFGCTHYQQVVWEVFDYIVASWDETGDRNITFLQAVKNTQAQMDKGIHIGRYGQIQEWKIDWDQPNDEHRHLSMLAGWYPGYSIAQYASNETITDAVRVALVARGNGTVDSNTGWEKVWRVACWAQLNDTDTAYTYLKYTITMNFAQNGFSVYTTCCWPYQKTAPFQIDANFGFSGAVLAMLVTDLPVPSASNATPVVILGPAIPPAWAGGFVTGLRLRGGGSVDFSWDDNGVVMQATIKGRSEKIVIVNVNGTVIAEQ